MFISMVLFVFVKLGHGSPEVNIGKWMRLTKVDMVTQNVGYPIGKGTQGPRVIGLTRSRDRFVMYFDITISLILGIIYMFQFKV